MTDRRPCAAAVVQFIHVCVTPCLRRFLSPRACLLSNFRCCSLISCRLSSEGRPGWVDLGHWVADYIPGRFTRPQTVTHPRTNRSDIGPSLEKLWFRPTHCQIQNKVDRPIPVIIIKKCLKGGRCAEWPWCETGKVSWKRASCTTRNLFVVLKSRVKTRWLFAAATLPAMSTTLSYVQQSSGVARNSRQGMRKIVGVPPFHPPSLVSLPVSSLQAPSLEK